MKLSRYNRSECPCFGMDLLICGSWVFGDTSENQIKKAPCFFISKLDRIFPKLDRKILQSIEIKLIFLHNT